MRKTLFLLLAGFAMFISIPAQAFEYYERTVLPQDVDGPYDIITADMDYDGDQDFVAVSYYDDDVYLYVNTDGYFGRHTIDASFDGGQKLHVADMDGDGDRDILGVAYNSDNVTWWENKGGWQFERHDITSSLDTPRDLVVVDLDNDNDLDIVVTAYTPDTVVWYENDGNTAPSFAPAATLLGTFDGSYALDAADFNNDGYMDLVATALGADDVVWLEHDGNTTTPGFTRHDIHTSIGDVYSVKAVDIDNDSDIDILTSVYNNSDVILWENDGNTTTVGFTRLDIDTDYGDNPFRVDAADMDGDGDLDIIAAMGSDNNQRGQAWWEQTSKRSFKKHIYALNTRSSRVVRPVDVDGNGTMDLILGRWSNDEIWVLNRSAETFGKLNLINKLPITQATSLAKYKHYTFLGLSFRSQVKVLDTSNPESPQLLTSIDNLGGDEWNPARWIEVAYPYLYVVNVEEDNLHAIDIRNPAAAIEVDRFGLSDNGGGVALSGNYALQGTKNGDLQIINISDPSNMSQTGSTSPGSNFGGVASFGDYALIADRGSRRLRIIDVSNPASPGQLTSLSVADNAQAMEIKVQYPYAYITCQQEGLKIIDISNMSSPKIVGSFVPGWFINDVDVEGNIAFVSLNGYQVNGARVGVMMLDITDKTNPKLLKEYTWEAYTASSSYEGAKDVMINGNYVYAAIAGHGMYTFSWSALPTTPTAAPTVGGPILSLEKDIDQVVNYPNPAKDQVTFLLDTQEAEKVTIHIYNLTGERVAMIEEETPGQRVSWQIEDLAPGLYLYKTIVIEDGEERTMDVKKIAIIK